MHPVNIAPSANDDELFRDSFLVNSTTDSLQVEQKVAALEDDRYVVIWRADHNPNYGSDNTILGRIFNADGSETSAEFRVDENDAAGFQTDDILSLPNGYFVVTWQEKPFGSFGSDSRLRVFDDTGQPVSDVVELASVSFSTWQKAYVEVLSDGRFIAVYPIGASHILEAQVFEADGTPSGTTFPIFLRSEAIGLNSIEVLDGDRLLVTWSDLATGYPEFGRFFSIEGTPEGPAFSVNETGPLNPTFVSGRTKLADGGFLVMDDDFDGRITVDDSPGLFAYFFDPQGSLQHVVQVNQETTGLQQRSSVDVLPNGQIVIAWISNNERELPAVDEIKARILNADGTPASDEFLVNEVTFLDRWEPDVAALENGQFVITWTSRDQLEDTDDWGVFARVYNGDGSPAERSGTVPATVITNEDTPYLFEAADLLANDSDTDGDALGIVSVSTTSALGATVMLGSDGTILYNPITSTTLDALNFGETLQDSFTYTVSDGLLTDTATATLTVGGLTDGGFDDFSVDGQYLVTLDALDAAGSSWFRIADSVEGTDILENDRSTSTQFIYVQGGLVEYGAWFDGTGGGQFRVFAKGAVDFRNQGDLIAPGESTGFSYTLSNGSSATDSATVVLEIEGTSFEGDDLFALSAEALASAGTGWFRLGAKNDETDLLLNDPLVDEIVLIDGAPIDDGIWFDGSDGGEFRVFSSGVVDFRNQGDSIEPGAQTGFEYGVLIDDEIMTAQVVLQVDVFDFL
ncbi:MAG: cadherin-like domain-containing protein [Paracoccaceae bacterium]|nr:cadherin-like domain-containing protein [Paracoccaceae bacterium]